MRSNYNHFVIFSVFQLNKSLEDNLLEHNRIKSELKHYNPIESIGSYKGTQERSIMVTLPRLGTESYNNLMKKINEYVNMYNQESILYAHNDRMTELHYASGKSEKLGYFIEISKSDAESMENYSIINGKYYSAIGS